MTTCPDHFNRIHLAACESTSDYLKQNIARFEADFPLMVSAAVQSAGRGRENRGWSSPENLGIYATFAFLLPDNRALSLLALAAGVAVIGMLESWAGGSFALKWPNDVLVAGGKIAGILCETVVKGERIVCLAGIGINVNQRREDFPPELRERAASLRLQTGREWPVAEGRERLAKDMAFWLQKLTPERGSEIVGRARELSGSFLGQAISFHHQGRVLRGIFLDIADDGGLLLGLPGAEKKIFYSGELG
ncbi:MAG: biotin--[acetyl-CoA-carboxylase] ligase [Candidatus Aminicenantes bacterium]|nr:biotin--[acetyl-CoA-carboxylase] ligase [Candidatus Aminicenantes bacterium]